MCPDVDNNFTKRTQHLLHLPLMLPAMLKQSLMYIPSASAFFRFLGIRMRLGSRPSFFTSPGRKWGRIQRLSIGGRPRGFPARLLNFYPSIYLSRGLKLVLNTRCSRSNAEEYRTHSTYGQKVSDVQCRTNFWLWGTKIEG